MKLRAVRAQRSKARADNLHCDRREVEAEADPWHLRQCIDMAQPTASVDQCVLSAAPSSIWATKIMGGLLVVDRPVCARLCLCVRPHISVRGVQLRTWWWSTG